MLGHLGALDKNGKITDVGSSMLEFPLHPQLSKALITSVDLKCSNEILSIVSILSGVLRNPRIFCKLFSSSFILVPHQIFVCSSEDEKQGNDAKIKFAHPGGDHLSLLNVYNAYKQSEN